MSIPEGTEFQPKSKEAERALDEFFDAAVQEMAKTKNSEVMFARVINDQLRDRFRIILEAHAAVGTVPPPRPKWYPIGVAPKDGTDIVGKYTDSLGNKVMAFCGYNGTYWELRGPEAPKMFEPTEFIPLP